MHVKGVSYVNERYTKGVLLLSKMAYNKGKGLAIGAKPPRIKLW